MLWYLTSSWSNLEVHLFGQTVDSTWVITHCSSIVVRLWFLQAFIFLLIVFMTKLYIQQPLSTIQRSFHLSPTVSFPFHLPECSFILEFFLVIGICLLTRVTHPQNLYITFQWLGHPTGFNREWARCQLECFQGRSSAIEDRLFVYAYHRVVFLGWRPLRCNCCTLSPSRS